jgi:hypothetical protein
MRIKALFSFQPCHTHSKGFKWGCWTMWCDIHTTTTSEKASTMLVEPARCFPSCGLFSNLRARDCDEVILRVPQRQPTTAHNVHFLSFAIHAFFNVVANHFLSLKKQRHKMIVATGRAASMTTLTLWGCLMRSVICKSIRTLVSRPPEANANANCERCAINGRLKTPRESFGVQVGFDSTHRRRGDWVHCTHAEAIGCVMFTLHTGSQGQCQRQLQTLHDQRLSQDSVRVFFWCSAWIRFDSAWIQLDSSTQKQLGASRSCRSNWVHGTCTSCREPSPTHVRMIVSTPFSGNSLMPAKLSLEANAFSQVDALSLSAQLRVPSSIPCVPLKVEIENLSQTPPKLQRSGTMMASSLDRELKNSDVASTHRSCEHARSGRIKVTRSQVSFCLAARFSTMGMASACCKCRLLVCFVTLLSGAANPSFSRIILTLSTSSLLREKASTTQSLSWNCMKRHPLVDALHDVSRL